MEKLYAIGQKVSTTYGHGDSGNPVHICPIDEYMGGKDYHPVFRNQSDAQKYLKELEKTSVTDYKIVPLTVFTPNP